MKHVHIRGVKQIEWECDHCHRRFPHGRRPPVQCSVCAKDLCKACKRHIHVETGSGNGAPIAEQVNETRNYCPDHFVVTARAILDIFGAES